MYMRLYKYVVIKKLIAFKSLERAAACKYS